MSRFLSISAAILSIVLLPHVVTAHALGASYETTVDGYTLDIGYSSPAPEVGEAVIFDFNFPTTQDSVPPYTDVWVRIETEQKVVFASALHNAHFGGPRMSYVFPEAGTYTIYVRYQNAEETFVEASFPMTVVPASQDAVSAALRTPGYGLAALGVLIALGVLLYTQRSRLPSRFHRS
jgi:hypothetical protein